MICQHRIAHALILNLVRTYLDLSCCKLMISALATLTANISYYGLLSDWQNMLTNVVSLSSVSSGNSTIFHDHGFVPNNSAI